MAVVELIQNSPEWKKFRFRKVGSSTAPIVMRASPHMTPFELWQVMRGIKPEPDFSSFVTQKGHEVEPIARAVYAIDKGVEVQKDVVMVHDEIPWMIASLDGFMVLQDEDGRIYTAVLEIKCVKDEVFQAAKNGHVHEEYVWQVEHQLIVSGAEWVDFMCVKAEKENGKWVIKEYHIVRYKSDPDRRALLLEKETEFMEMVLNGIAPALSSRDALERDEPEIVKIYSEMATLKDQIDAKNAEIERLAEQLEPLKKHAIAAMKHTKEKASGLTLTKQESISTDNKAVLSTIEGLVDTTQFEKTKVTYVLRRA